MCGPLKGSSRMYFDDRGDDKLGKVKDPLAKAVKYVKTRSPKEKLVMLCICGFVVSLSLDQVAQG